MMIMAMLNSKIQLILFLWAQEPMIKYYNLEKIKAQFCNQLFRNHPSHESTIANYEKTMNRDNSKCKFCWLTCRVSSQFGLY